MSTMTGIIEQGKIRFPGDTLTDIAAVRTALEAFAKQEQDPYVFQAILYFFSCLIENPNNIRDALNIRLLWSLCRAQLRDADHFIYHDAATCRQTDWIIEQLDPVATVQELTKLAASHIKGNPKSRLGFSNDDEVDFVIVSRGYDWILRCVYQLNIPATWKLWLNLMYEKQPSMPMRMDRNIGNDIFMLTLEHAAITNGWEAVVSITKFWLRQLLTIVEVWNTRLIVNGDESGEDGLGEPCMPSYLWCDAAYLKMVYRFRSDLRDPFSDYSYMLRQEVLCGVTYQHVFEQCWERVYTATCEIGATDYDPFEARMMIHDCVLTKVAQRYQPNYLCTVEALAKEFGEQTEDGQLKLLAEDPIVSVYSLEGDLGVACFGHNLCESFYHPSERHPFMAEMELTDDVQLEPYGLLLDLTEFTTIKQPAAGDFCSCCQYEITVTDSPEMQCLKPVSCKDTFHASCLATWVNSVSKKSNRCPNCMVQMTKQKRCQRKVI